MTPLRARSDCYVGVDLGTSGCRAIAIDRHGRGIAEARATLPPSRHPAPGASEQDPQDWWSGVTRVLAGVAERAPGRIRAISVDGTSSTLLLCDKHGIPCSTALMYDDSRARDQAQRIEAVAPAGSPARGAGSALAKLLYLLEHGGKNRPAHALHQADWIAGRLGAGYGIADENNVLKLGYDPVARKWPDWLLAWAGVPPLLPEVCPVGHVTGRIAAEVARSLGLPDDVRLVAGTTDSNAATLAAGISRTGDAVTSLGSTLVLKIYSEHPIAAAQYGVYSHRIGDRWLAGGASNSGGAVLRQFFSDAQVAALSERIDPDRPLGLDYYPLPGAGERFPFNDPDRRPRMQPRPATDHAFLQALLEGIAAIEAAGYRRLAQLGAPYPRRVWSSGGGARNRVWQRIRERVLGVPVEPAMHSEAAYGAALLARAAIISDATDA